MDPVAASRLRSARLVKFLPSSQRSNRFLWSFPYFLFFLCRLRFGCSRRSCSEMYIRPFSRLLRSHDGLCHERIELDPMHLYGRAHLHRILLVRAQFRYATHRSDRIIRFFLCFLFFLWRRRFWYLGFGRRMHFRRVCFLQPVDRLRGDRLPFKPIDLNSKWLFSLHRVLLVSKNLRRCLTSRLDRRWRRWTST